jgi:hypothetical protein
MSRPNSKTATAVLGSSAHSDYDRAENDFYATPPEAVDALLEMGEFVGIRWGTFAWEPCAGEGHIVRALKDNLLAPRFIYASDIIQREFGLHAVVDFLDCERTPVHVDYECDIITNPPYSLAEEFSLHGYDLLRPGRYMALLLRIQFLEGIQRYKSLFSQGKYPKHVFVFSSRIQPARNGDFEGSAHGSAVCYAWFVWEKGYVGDTVIDWIPPIVKKEDL